MVKILFVCYGNIYRSPMALMIFKDIIHKNHKEDFFFCDSCATSYEEIGNDIYPPVKKKLEEKKIPFSNHQAKIFQEEDYHQFDFIIVMEESNKEELLRLIEDKEKKIHLLLEYTKEVRDIEDPWYTRDFEKAYQDIYHGCVGLYQYLMGNHHGKMENTK